MVRTILEEQLLNGADYIKNDCYYIIDYFSFGRLGNAYVAAF